jgi:Uri superfamily endonuclease
MNCIYAFFYKDSGSCVYVGSTINFWRRYGQHMMNSETTHRDVKIYKEIKERGGWANIEYRILEENLDKKDLLSREKHYYLELKPSGNSQSPLLTEDEKISQKKKYNECYKRKSIVCECGSHLPDCNWSIERHILTKKHQRWINSI